MPNVSNYYLLCERKGEEIAEVSFIYQSCLSNYKTMFYSPDIISKTLLLPSSTWGKFHHTEQYLQRRVFMYIGDKVKAMEHWQRITTQIPLSNQQHYFQGSLETRRKGTQKSQTKYSPLIITQIQENNGVKRQKLSSWHILDNETERSCFHS